MPSPAYDRWATVRLPSLDEIGLKPEHNCSSLREAFTLMLAAHFQGFCRDLHEECSQHLARCVEPTTLRLVVQKSLTTRRKLDDFNARQESLADDFGRFMLEFGPVLEQSPSLFSSLAELSQFRNAIAHQTTKVRIESMTLETVLGWRDACAGLAKLLDQTMGTHLKKLTNAAPWELGGQYDSASQ